MDLSATERIMAKSPDGWKLVESGRYAEAIAQFQRDFDQDHEAPSIFNMGVAQICSGDAAAAIKSFDSLLDRSEVGTSNYAMSGVARWILGRRAESVRLWKEGMKCKYADAAGGMELPLLLYYAAVRDPSAMSLRDARAMVTKASKHPWADSWPGPLGAYVTGRITEALLRQEAVFDEQDVMRAQQAQVDFYVGVKALEKGESENFTRQMVHCAAVPRWHLENEFHLAQHEVVGVIAPGSRQREANNKGSKR
jgi:hypothetical protein